MAQEPQGPPSSPEEETGVSEPMEERVSPSRLEYYFFAFSVSPLALAVIWVVTYLLVPESWRMALRDSHLEPWPAVLGMGVATIFTCLLGRLLVHDKELDEKLRLTIQVVIFFLLAIGMGAVCHWCGSCTEGWAA